MSDDDGYSSGWTSVLIGLGILALIALTVGTAAIRTR